MEEANAAERNRYWMRQSLGLLLQCAELGDELWRKFPKMSRQYLILDTLRVRNLGDHSRIAIMRVFENEIKIALLVQFEPKRTSPRGKHIKLSGD